MTSPYRIERERGTKEARQQLAVLREKWPLAFPVQHQDVRPLAMGAAGEIAAVMGWSLPYTLGVLGRWKMAEVYCQGVLCHDQRIALDGSPAETVDAEAKDLATKQLALLAARKAAKKAAEAAAPAVVKPKHAPAPAPSNCATGCVQRCCAGTHSRERRIRERWGATMVMAPTVTRIED
jgi:sRNA-binding protein